MFTFENINVDLFGYSLLTDILKVCTSLPSAGYSKTIWNLFTTCFKTTLEAKINIRVNVIENLQNYPSMEILVTKL